MTTDETNDYKPDAKDLMIQLEFSLDDLDKLQEQIREERENLLARMMLEGIQAVKGYYRGASLRNNTPSRSFKYDKLLKDDSNLYDVLLEDGYIKYTDPKSPQSLVIKKVE